MLVGDVVGTTETRIRGRPPDLAARRERSPAVLFKLRRRALTTVDQGRRYKREAPRRDM